MFDNGCMDVGFCMFRHWILVVWTLKFVCMDVEFCLVGSWIMVVWTLDSV